MANLGQGADSFHPNNRAKVELPLAARMAKALAPLLTCAFAKKLSAIGAPQGGARECGRGRDGE